MPKGVNAACTSRFGNGCERDPQATNWCETGVKRIRGLIRKRVRTRVRNGYTGRCAGRCKTKQARERAREYECETDASVREGVHGKVHVRKAHAPQFCKSGHCRGIIRAPTRPPYSTALLARWYRAVHARKHAVQSHQNECNRQTNWQQNAYRFNNRGDIRLPHLEGSSVVRV